jgi:hypothetical protein
MENRCHLDCEAFLAIDVFKGLCHVKKEMVLADEAACEAFEQVKKCRFCKNYQPTEDYLGNCKGKFITYPDLLAKTCDDFR